MNTYKCEKCGSLSHSSLSWALLQNKTCIEPGCGGVIIPDLPDYRKGRRTFNAAAGFISSALVFVLILSLLLVLGNCGAAPDNTPGELTGTPGVETQNTVYEQQQQEPALTLEHTTTTKTVSELEAKRQEPAETKEPEPVPAYALTVAERDLVERVVMAESGGEPYEGQMLVAQCIYNACVLDGIQPAEAVIVYQYSPNRPDPSESVKKAVAAVFDLGETATDEPILYFYAPAWCTSSWHESQCFVIELGGHRFFKEW